MSAENYERFQQAVRDLALPHDRINRLWAQLRDIDEQIDLLNQYGEGEGDGQDRAKLEARITSMLKNLEHHAEKERAAGRSMARYRRVPTVSWADVYDTDEEPEEGDEEYESFENFALA
eukprot:s1193_g7.t1